MGLISRKVLFLTETMPRPRPDSLDAEHDYLRQLYACVAQQREDAVRRLSAVMAERGGTPQARSERESYNALYTARIRQIDAAQAGLCFGRLDMVGTPGDVTRYIGRMGVQDERNGEYSPLLIDWRAPLASPFYLATTAHPSGVWRRRTLRTIGATITHCADEYLMSGEAPPGYPQPVSDESGSVVSESALLQALNEPRTGQMTDIVATIQREQDAIIRCSHRGVVVVEGGPGTGKTAVALHRAAYLLYTYRSVLERSGVLIVGPNSTFLHYIDQVLPSLGESGVVLHTVGSLFPGVSTEVVDTPAAQQIKGDIRMVTVVKNVVRDYQTVLEENRTIRVDGTPFTVTPAMVRTARTRARRSRRPHNEAQKVFHDALAQQIVDAYAQEIGTDVTDPTSSRTLLSTSDIADLIEDVLYSDEVQAIVMECWPVLTPHAVVTRLVRDRECAERVCRRVLNDDEREAIVTSARSSVDIYTVSDVPLLDEAAEIVGKAPRRSSAEGSGWSQMVEDAQDALDILKASASLEFEDESDTEILAAYDIIDAQQLAHRHRVTADQTTAERASEDREWAYGHVIVDEAQELSPMAWRMLMRRSPNRWMTIVGDTAQTSHPAGVQDWSETLQPYVEKRWKKYSLTINYRTPEEIMDVAGNVLAQINPQIEPPQSLRAVHHPVEHWDRMDDSWVDAVLACVEYCLAHRNDERRSIGVITSHEHFPQLSSLTWNDSVACFPVSAAKGLEFDITIIVDPVGIVEESSRGFNDMYVALTRATQSCVVVHEGELPQCLETIVPHPVAR